MTDFATLFREKRIERNISQSDMAERLHVTKQAISKWENGKSMPDIGLMPQIAELLGVSVDELLTGKEPEPRIVEKVVIKEKEVTKPIPARKILAIALPLVLVIVLASALLGVYVPKAIAANTPPIIETPEPEPPEIVYYEASALFTEPSAWQYSAPLQNGVAYYSFMPEFNSDYKFYFVAPYDAKIKIDDNDYVVLKEDDEVEMEGSRDRKYTYSAYMTKGSMHYIEIDLTDCYEWWGINPLNAWLAKFCICQKVGYDDITVRAGSDYTFLIKKDSYYRELKYYKLQSNDIRFTSWHNIESISIPYDVLPYEGCPSRRLNYVLGKNINIIDCDIDDLGVMGMQFISGINYDPYDGYACTVHNYSDEDIVLSVAEPEIETTSLDTAFTYNSQSTPQYLKVSALTADGGAVYPSIYLYMHKNHPYNLDESNNLRYMDIRFCNFSYGDWIHLYPYYPIWSNDEWMCFYLQNVSNINYVRLEKIGSVGNDFSIEMFFSGKNPYKLFEQDKPKENEDSE